MEFLFELIFELILEGAVAGAGSKKVPRWLRYVLVGLLSLLVIGLLGGICALGIYLLVRKEGLSWAILGIVILILDAIMIVSAVFKARAQLKRRKEERKSSDSERGEEK